MRLYLFALLAALCLGSCSSSTSTDPLNGFWHVKGQNGAYATWEISGDTVYINRRGIYYSLGRLATNDDGTKEITTNRGIWSLVGDPASDKFRLEPGPGTSGDGNDVVRANPDPVNDFYSMVSVKPNLPSASEVETLASTRYLHRLFIKPDDPSKHEGRPYSMQVGEDWHKGRITQVAQFVEFIRTRYTDQERPSLRTCLYIDAAMKMKEVNHIKYELRSTDQFNVCYMLAPGHSGMNEIGIKRNLFMLTPQENYMIAGDSVTEEDIAIMKAELAVRGNFYTSIFKNPDLHYLHVNADGKVALDSLVLEGDLLYKGIKGIVKSYEQEKENPTFIITTDDEATYQAYISAMNTYLKAVNDLRDEYSMQAFKGKFSDINESQEHGKEAKDFVLKKYPHILVDMTKEAMILYGPE